MSSQIKNISQTALLVAGCRAKESEKKGAFFKDHLAHLFLDSHGKEFFNIFQKSPQFNLFNTSVVVRTAVLDKMILEILKKKQIQQVINLGAGLDNRPYRIPLQKSITWWELDRLELMVYKEKILEEHSPNCIIKRKGLDLNDIKHLSNFINTDIDHEKKTLILSEGFLIYLESNKVSEYLAHFSNLDFCSYWITDIGSHKIISLNNTESKSEFAQLLSFMKFFSSPFDEIYAENNWKVKIFKDLAIEAIKLNRPFTNQKFTNQKNKLLLEIQSLKWAKLHYILYLENENSLMR